MKRINLILTLFSLNTILVTIERFSFTTKLILQPYSFLRLHEVFQMVVVILLTVVLPFFLLKELTSNFGLLKTRRGTLLGLLFVIGVYFYSTGNGAHEIASYLFNTFCPTEHFTSTFCGSAFFNDYYFGNILYFIGLLMVNLSLVIFERMNPSKNFTNKDIIVTLVNGFVLALTMFAYAAFDRVLVGFAFLLVAGAIIDFLLLTSHTKFRYLPFTVYSAAGYTIALIASAVVRFR